MPGTRRQRIWAGRALCLLLLAGLATYMIAVGLDRADKLGSAIAAVLSLAALLAPYAIPAPQPPPSPRPDVHAGGAAAVAIGEINHGRVTTDVSGQVPAPQPPPPGGGVSATGPGSVAIGGTNRGDIDTTFHGPTQPG